MSMSWFDIFRRKKQPMSDSDRGIKEVLPIPETLPSPEPINAQRALLPEPTQLDRIEQKLDSHDSYVRDNVPTNASLKDTSGQLLQQLQQLLQQLPTATSSVITAIAELNEGHRNIVNLFLNQDYPDHYTFEEISQRLNMPESSVRGYISALEKIGYRFDRIKLGKKLKVRLSEDIIRQLLQQKQTAT